MGRLIDADKFKKDNEWLLNCDFPYHTENTLEELIDSAPTVDAEPVRHGRWEKVKRSEIEERLNKIYHISTVKCSCCNAQLDKTNIASVEALNYCPVCGAKMDLKDEVTK